MDKKFIESLGWRLIKTVDGYTRWRSDNWPEWVKAKVYHFELNGKKITHVEGSESCTFYGNGSKLYGKKFDKAKFVDYTALLKKYLKIKENPYLYTAGEFLEVTKKLTTLTK